MRPIIRLSTNWTVKKMKENIDSGLPRSSSQHKGDLFSPEAQRPGVGELRDKE